MKRFLAFLLVLLLAVPVAFGEEAPVQAEPVPTPAPVDTALLIAAPWLGGSETAPEEFVFFEDGTGTLNGTIAFSWSTEGDLITVTETAAEGEPASEKVFQMITTGEIPVLQLQGTETQYAQAQAAPEPQPTESNIIPGKNIAPFLPVTWTQVMEEGDAVRQIIGTKGKADWVDYRITINTVDKTGSVVGVIECSDEDLLQIVWRRLGDACIRHFTSYEQRPLRNANVLASYAFTDPQTYMLWEYNDYGSYQYIIFVALAN